MTRAILTAADFKELPIPQGAILWEDGAVTNAPGFEVADGSAAANDPSYTKPSLCHGRFPKPAASYGADAGDDSHSHTVPSHNHGNTSAASLTARMCNSYGDRSGALNTHVHGTNNNSSSTSNDSVVPPYRTVRPMVYTMKAGGGGRGLLTLLDLAASALPPREIIVGYAQTGTPTGWRDCDGGTQNGVTVPNLIGKFLKGVPNISTDPGGTGGSDNHAHDVSHSHGSTNSGDQWVKYDNDDEPKSDFADNHHTHTVGSASLTSGAATNHPANQTIRYLCFVGYGPNSHAHPRGLLAGADLHPSLRIGAGLNAIWAKTLASIPSGWSHNTSFNDRMMRHVSSSSDAGGGTGGSATHNHTGNDHQHTTGGPSTYTGESVGGGDRASSKTHTHTTGSAIYSAIGNQVSNMPPYFEIAVIKKAEG
jgi:hypothetical protein